jgi:hypothetical protein
MRVLRSAVAGDDSSAGMIRHGIPNDLQRLSGVKSM